MQSDAEPRSELKIVLKRLNDYNSVMVATLRQIVTVQPGGVVRMQSDVLREGAIAEIVVTSDTSANPTSPQQPVLMTWNAFIGAGTGAGRSVEDIDASIRELRDEWL